VLREAALFPELTETAKSIMVVDKIVMEKGGRFLQAIKGKKAKHYYRVMGRSDTIEQIKQEITWLSVKLRTSATNAKSPPAKLTTVPLKLPPKTKRSTAYNQPINQATSAAIAAARAALAASKRSSEPGEQPGVPAVSAFAPVSAATERPPISIAHAQMAVGPSQARSVHHHMTVNLLPPINKFPPLAAAKTATTTANSAPTSSSASTSASSGSSAPLPPNDNKSRVPQSPSRTQQQHKPWLRVNKEQIEEAIPTDASCVVHIFDRRVNLDAHPADASMYSLLRSWAQDDPYRRIPAVGIDLADLAWHNPGTDASSKSSAAVVTSIVGITSCYQPPPKVNVLSRIGKEQSAHKDTIQQIVRKAKETKHRKQGEHKARMAAAMLCLERRGIHPFTLNSK
jgi:hypothetical protein